MGPGQGKVGANMKPKKKGEELLFIFIYLNLKLALL
jgi:hypothetical protein